MRKLSATIFVGAASLMLGVASAAQAQMYVGSWEVDQGPNWSGVPTAYSGLDAAAFLFGGSASDYAISTVGTDPSQINDLAWVSTWGGACGDSFPCGTQVGDSFVQSTGGLYATPGDTSAYVTDWAIGSQYTNYAFRITASVPEPATWAMMIIGFGAIGFAMRRNRTAAAHQFA